MAQKYARNPTKTEAEQIGLMERMREGELTVKNKDSGQLIYLPVTRALAVVMATLRLVGWPLPNFLWASLFTMYPFEPSPRARPSKKERPPPSNSTIAPLPNY